MWYYLQICRKVEGCLTCFIPFFTYWFWFHITPFTWSRYTCVTGQRGMLISPGHLIPPGGFSLRNSFPRKDLFFVTWQSETEIWTRKNRPPLMCPGILILYYLWDIRDRSLFVIFTFHKHKYGKTYPYI